MTLPISLFLIAKNEADRIEAAIASAEGLVDEIVVVDSSSEDDTAERARAAGATVHLNPWPGYGAQKRFAEDRCRHDWLLNLDADERLDRRLRATIRALFEDGAPEAPGYRLRIVDCYPHEEKPHWRARAYTPVRLYDKRRARYRDHPTFDRVELDEKSCAVLDGVAEHRSIRSLTHLAAKLRAYSDARIAVDAGRKRMSLPRLLTAWPLSFFKDYLSRGHVFGGAYGFAVAFIAANARFERAARLWANQRYGEDA